MTVGPTRGSSRAGMVLGAATLLVSCGTSGPSPDDPEVAGWADSTTAEAEESADRLAERIAGVLPAGSAPIASVQQFRCSEGQHNWKIDDPYDLSCTVTVGTLVEVPHADRFAADMAAVDDVITSSGFETPTTSVDEVAVEYGGGFGGLGSWTGRDGDPVPYGPQHLPDVGYRHPDARRSLALIFTGPDERNPDVLLYPGGVERMQWTTSSGDEIAAEDLPALLDGASYGLLVAVQEGRSW